MMPKMSRPCICTIISISRSCCSTSFAHICRAKSCSPYSLSHRLRRSMRLSGRNGAAPWLTLWFEEEESAVSCSSWLPTSMPPSICCISGVSAIGLSFFQGCVYYIPTSILYLSTLLWRTIRRDGIALIPLTRLIAVVASASLECVAALNGGHGAIDEPIGDGWFTGVRQQAGIG